MNDDSADTEDLTRLALGTLDPGGRARLTQRALVDAAFARELKLALRLADESAALTRAWVQVAAQAPAAHLAGWRRPLAGVAASLAIAAAVMMVPRQSQMPSVAAPTVAMQDVSGLPDSLSAGSFEAAESDSIGNGSFE
jgi:hypothetical protein